MTTAASLIPALVLKSWLPTGLPNAFGTVSTFSAGTATPVATYTDWTAGTPNPNPLTLNARGEANVYLLPNVAYKIVEADQFGNQIRSTDQVNNSQLITLYGGVDTGSVNAYIINFTANFSAYTDGIVVYFIPANANTGPSTINVNGLGVINILGPTGGSLPAGSILANFPTGIIYKGGSFYLTSVAPTTTGTFTGTFTGFTAVQTQTVSWVKNGPLIYLNMNLSVTGVSNSTALSMTGLPAALSPARSMSALVPFLIDNGIALTTPGTCALQATTTTINFFTGATGAGPWTASGTKVLNGFTLIYSLI